VGAQKKTQQVKRAEAKKPKSRIVSLRMDEDDFNRLDSFARQTSRSRGEVLRCCLAGARLKSTVDAQALTEVSRVHADLNRIGGLLKLAIREGVVGQSSYRRLNLELVDSVIQVRHAIGRLAGHK
jgi:predicted transcriptional regulator